jgi:hypothetical protein
MMDVAGQLWDDEPLPTVARNEVTKMNLKAVQEHLDGKAMSLIVVKAEQID